MFLLDGVRVASITHMADEFVVLCMQAMYEQMPQQLDRGRGPPSAYCFLGRFVCPRVSAEHLRIRGYGLSDSWKVLRCLVQFGAVHKGPYPGTFVKKAWDPSTATLEKVPHWRQGRRSPTTEARYTLDEARAILRGLGEL